MVAPGETVADIAPEEVVRHEYGHHIAFNRLNAPWTAVDWGPKRWASAANVCARVARREAYPGDEGSNYALNPGEAWAEAYRLMDERKAGITTATWQIVVAELLPERGGAAGGRRGRAPAVDGGAHDRLDARVRQGDAEGVAGSARDAARRRTCASARRCRTAERTTSHWSRANRRTVVRRARVGRPAREAARRLRLRPALALRAGHAEGRARTGSRVGDGAVSRALGGRAVLAAALVDGGRRGGDGRDRRAATSPRRTSPRLA